MPSRPLPGPSMKTSRPRAQEGGTIKWKMTRSYQLQNKPEEAWASGRVTKLTETSADLNGKYDDRSTNPRVHGQSLNYSMTRSGDTLEGRALGAAGTYFYVSLKGVK